MPPPPPPAQQHGPCPTSCVPLCPWHPQLSLPPKGPLGDVAGLEEEREALQKEVVMLRAERGALQGQVQRVQMDGAAQVTRLEQELKAARQETEALRVQYEEHLGAGPPGELEEPARARVAQLEAQVRALEAQLARAQRQEQAHLEGACQQERETVSQLRLAVDSLQKTGESGLNVSVRMLTGACACVGGGLGMCVEELVSHVTE